LMEKDSGSSTRVGLIVVWKELLTYLEEDLCRPHL
jgi:hypothetical protein